MKKVVNNGYFLMFEHKGVTIARQETLGNCFDWVELVPQLNNKGEIGIVIHDDYGRIQASTVTSREALLEAIRMLPK